MSQEINSGLKRRAITTCSRWAEACRVMPPIKGIQFAPSPWSFKHYPWLKMMHDFDEDLIVGQKSAQMGFTEWALNKALYTIDIKRTDVLYVLPSKTPDAKDFSASRFDAALELSPHLSTMFSDVKNIGHKRAGSTNLYIRGSKSESGLKSIPVGLVILDELEEMNQQNVPLAMERLSGQREKRTLMLSTPTIPAKGINVYFRESTQDHFFFKCPGCSRMTELEFPGSIELCGESVNDPNIKKSYYKCKECQKRLHHELKSEWLENNEWVSANSEANSRGVYINQMYSPTISAPEFARSYQLSLTNPAEEQNFFNSKLGKEHAPEGAQITEEDLNACIDEGGHYKSGSMVPRSLVTMGIDVGKYLHFHIDEWLIGDPLGDDFNTNSTCRCLHFGKVSETDYKTIDLYFQQFRVAFLVIDALPNRKDALQLCNKFYGRAKYCFYGQGISGKQININNSEQHRIDVDRTSWLDMALSRYHNHTIGLPSDIDAEYRTHLKALVRTYRRNRDGNYEAYYDCGNNEDHYAHARNYSEIAFSLAAKMSSNRNIRGVI